MMACIQSKNNHTDLAIEYCELIEAQKVLYSKKYNYQAQTRQ